MDVGEGSARAHGTGTSIEVSVVLQEAARRAEAAEHQRLKEQRDEAERRRKRLEAGFAQVRAPGTLDEHVDCGP